MITRQGTLSVKSTVAIRAVGFHPCSANIHRMPEFQAVLDACKLQLPGDTLADYCMAQVAVPCNCFSIPRFKAAVMAAEATVGLKMTNMNRIFVI